MAYEHLEEPLVVQPMSQSPSRSESYYWENVTVQVEDKLFRFPKHHLMRRSKGSDEPEGVSDDRPIKLWRISSVDFERLLQVLHPIKNPIFPQAAWLSVLRLSNLWRLKDTRNTAISHLTTLSLKVDPVHRIILGRKYSVAQWYSSGYIDLVHRVEPGVGRPAIGIQNTRHAFSFLNGFDRCEHPRSHNDNAFQQSFDDKFKDDFREVIQIRNTEGC
ncbi:hypothetical protein IW261DRAFT_1454989 [Armillaria novae-zelandiae]|uniref:BTB domain-containing protein n=1 Tax=Armillaria novae-zelandiae TaxID=153914 RepID=A0AA39PL68_9AGAR|nr:hypothetical protein IW261DRAFT_1454989 [Armillaria novae-zelandiae]